LETRILLSAVTGSPLDDVSAGVPLAVEAAESGDVSAIWMDLDLSTPAEVVLPGCSRVIQQPGSNPREVEVSPLEDDSLATSFEVEEKQFIRSCPVSNSRLRARGILLARFSFSPSRVEMRWITAGPFLFQTCQMSASRFPRN
jgi:hypothetical protein